MSAPEEPKVDEYVVPEKVSLEELKNRDTEDESLAAYKESLLGSTECHDPNDPRKVIIVKFEILIPDAGKVIEIDPNDETALATPIVLKQGTAYRIKVYYYIQHDVVLGLKYVNKVYRKGVRVDVTEEMLGGFPPRKEVYEYTFPEEEAPSGMLARGTYTARTVMSDDDGDTHISFEYQLAIKKEWE
ncbi:MAG: hypothetical protein MHM6MM_005371 [Cercozoa sp. M6MM]